MKNFKLDYFLSQRLKELSEKTDLSEIEIIQEMFLLFEEKIMWDTYKNKEEDET